MYVEILLFFILIVQSVHLIIIIDEHNRALEEKRLQQNIKQLISNQNYIQPSVRVQQQPIHVQQSKDKPKNRNRNKNKNKAT